MKKISLIVVGAAALIMASCAKPTSTLEKDIRYMPIRFKPLSRADVTLVGNLQSEITITGAFTKYGKVPDNTFRGLGLVNSYEASQVMYFSPGQNEAISGDLYNNNLFNDVVATNSAVQHRSGFFNKIFRSLFKEAAAKQDAMRALYKAMNKSNEYAYYTLIQKYPDIDYFVNVRFDRKTVVQGAKYTEVIILKADGVKLKTD